MLEIYFEVFRWSESI